MTKDDIQSLMKGIAPVMRDMVAARLLPLEMRILALERELAGNGNVDEAAQRQIEGAR